MKESKNTKIEETADKLLSDVKMLNIAKLAAKMKIAQSINVDIPPFLETGLVQYYRLAVLAKRKKFIEDNIITYVKNLDNLIDPKIKVMIEELVKTEEI